MSHSCVQIYLHIIFSTKERRPLIPEDMEHRLYGYIAGITNTHKIPIIQINGTADHVHILMKYSGLIPLPTLIKEMKAYSTGWIKKQGYKDFRWQQGYGAFSCSIGHVPPLINYIKNQKEHHKTHSFKEELDRICKLWRVEWQIDDDEESNDECFDSKF